MPNLTHRAGDSRRFYYRCTKKLKNFHMFVNFLAHMPKVENNSQGERGWLKSFSDVGVLFGPKYSTHKMEAFPQKDTHKSGWKRCGKRKF